MDNHLKQYVKMRQNFLILMRRKRKDCLETLGFRVGKSIKYQGAAFCRRHARLGYFPRRLTSSVWRHPTREICMILVLTCYEDRNCLQIVMLPYCRMVVNECGLDRYLHSSFIQRRMVDIVVFDTIETVIAILFQWICSGLGPRDVRKPNLDKKTLCVLYYMLICTLTAL